MMVLRWCLSSLRVVSQFHNVISLGTVLTWYLSAMGKGWSLFFFLPYIISRTGRFSAGLVHQVGSEKALMSTGGGWWPEEGRGEERGSGSATLQGAVGCFC